MRLGKRGIVQLSALILITISTIILIISTHAATAQVPKSTYTLDETIRLDLTQYNPDRVKITTPSTQYIQRSETTKFFFSPEEVGKHSITIYSGDTTETFEFEITPPTQIPKEVINTEEKTPSTAPSIKQTIPTKEGVRLGQPVEQRKRFKIIEGQPETQIDLPVNAYGIELYMMEPENKQKIEDYTIQEALRIATTDTKTAVTITSLSGEIEMKYLTPGPKAQEKTISQTKKEVLIYTQDNLHYEDVTAFTSIPEITKNKDLISIYWKEENTYLEVTNAKDTDGNGLLDYVEWIVPHLSNQTFEIAIEVLNVQSYPVVNGPWTVTFATSGTADLYIRAVDNTTWSNGSDENDLVFQDLLCGNESVAWEWSNDAIYVANYSCEETGSETSIVKTLGDHHLEFTFGGVTKYAHNDASPIETGVYEYGGSGWETIETKRNYVTLPAVIVKPNWGAEISANYEAATVIVQNVTPTSFEVQLRNETDSIPGNISYLVAQNGTHDLENGIQLQAGRLEGITNYDATGENAASWYTINFHQAYASAPTIMASPNNASVADWISSRFDAPTLTTSAVDISLERDELSGSAPLAAATPDVIGWVTINRTNATNMEAGYDSGVLDTPATGTWTDIGFDSTYTNPIFFGITGEGGSDPSTIGINKANTTSIQYRVTEDREDGEQAHASTDVMWMIFESDLGITTPIITNEQARDIKDSSVNITWDTDVDANSTVHYGLTTALGSVRGFDDILTNHSVLLFGLDENTTYFYNVTSCSADDYCNTTGTFNFTTITGTPPEIFNVTPSLNELVSNPINLSASTTEEAYCQFSTNQTFIYGLGTNFTFGQGSEFHQTSLGNLAPGFYTYYIKCEDQQGNANNNTDQASATFEVKVPLFFNISQIYEGTPGATIALATPLAVNLTNESFVVDGLTPNQSIPSRLHIGKNGWYKISYMCTILSGINNRVITEGWIRKNGAEEIAPSRMSCYSRTTTADSDRCAVQGTTIANFTQGEYIELMLQQLAQQASGSMVTDNDCWMYVQQVRRPVAQIYDSNGGTSFSVSTEITLDLDTETYADMRAFTADTANSQIEVDVTGWYKIYQHGCYQEGSQGNRFTVRQFIHQNGVELEPSTNYNYVRSTNIADRNCGQAFMLYNLSDGDEIEIRAVKHSSESSDGTASITLSNQSWLTLEQISSTDVFMAYQDVSTQAVPELNNDPVTFDTLHHRGASYNYTQGDSQVTILTEGFYEVSYALSWDDLAEANQLDRTVVCAYLELNGQTLQPSRLCDYTRGDDNARWSTVSGTVVVNATEGSTIELFVNPEGRSVNVTGQGTWLNIVPLNVFIQETPPNWLVVGANNTTPGINENVTFFTNWTDSLGLSTWTFFWDIGSGFVPAGTGSFTGSPINGTSAIGKIIPPATEGQEIQYFFRATNIDGFTNQTATASVNVQDISAPLISSSNVTPRTANYSTPVTITTTVTDTTEVNAVWAQITFPDNTQTNQSLVNISANIYQTGYAGPQIGRYNATIVANDTLGNQGNSSIKLHWNVTGFAEISFIDPTGGNYDYGTSNVLRCGVADANLSTGIANYPVRFYSEGQLLGTNRTNSTGGAEFSWSITGNGNTQLDCVIANNNTLFYTASQTNDTVNITVEVPNIELVDLTHENKEFSPSVAWYSSSWDKRKRITIPQEKIGGDLSDFPLLIEIYDENLRTDARSDGFDILFTAADRTTKLDHEITIFNQTYNATDARLTAWVKVDLSASEDTDIYLYYNNSGASDQENATGVWTNGYVAVYHYEDTLTGAASDLSDSSPNNNDGTSFNMGSGDTITGIVGSGYDFTSASAQYLQLPELVGGRSQITVEYWVLNPSYNDGRAFSSGGSGTSQVLVWPDNDNGFDSIVDGARANGGAVEGYTGWNYHAMAYTGAQVQNYENGALAGTAGKTGTVATIGGLDYFGRDGGAVYFNDDADELRVSSVARNQSWLNATYTNLIEKENFITVNSEQTYTPPVAELNEYETTDNIAWINTTVTNNGDASASDVLVYLNLLHENGTRASWFTTQTENCGSIGEGSSCTSQFNNSGTGFNIATTSGGLYAFNITVNWTGGGNVPAVNITETTQIHHVPNNFTGYLTDAEIPRDVNTSYAFEFTNPWSADLTNMNVTITCPTGVSGMTCECTTNPGSTTCPIGEVSSLEFITREFLVTTNASTPIGTYDINMTVTYVNPTNNTKTWTQYYNQDLIVRPLLGLIETYPETIVRGSSTNLSGYGHNIGLDTLEEVNLSWDLPNVWINTSGSLYSEVASLISDDKFYSNITVNVPIAALLGPQEINLTADSPNASSSTSRRTINVTATTAIPQISVNNSQPLRNEQIRISAKLAYDNGTEIANQEIIFQNNDSLSGTTNASGDAIINYTIPNDATIGTNAFEIRANFSGNPADYILASTNTTNISVQDILAITQWNNPGLIGFGYNVTIYANATSTSAIDTVIANITYPNGSNQQFTMTNISTETFLVNFTNTWQNGQYNYTIIANNTAGFTNQTQIPGNFTVSGNSNISLKTVADVYLIGQQVNLTDNETITDVINVQAEQGSIAVSGTTNTETLSQTYQLNKSFIVADSAGSGTTSANPDIRMGRVYFSSITNGYSNELTAERSSTTDNMIATYSVLQADNIDVCHISHDMPASDGNEDVSLASCDVPLPSNYAEKCFVSTWHNVEANSASASCNEEQRVLANITDQNTLNLRRSTDTACGISTVEAQVVCFNDDTNVTPVQIGPIQFSSGVTTPIGHTVNTSNSWLMYSCQTSGNEGIEHGTIECYLNGGSDITCRTSSAGTGETSTQECVGYVVEFFDAENAEADLHIPSGTDVGDNTVFTTDISQPVDSLNKTLGFCVSSFVNGEGNALARGDYACYLSDSNTYTCERGQTGNTDPSNDLHCTTVQWPNQTSTSYNPTFLENSGGTNINAYLLMTVQSNSSGEWLDYETILNDTATDTVRQFSIGELLNLTNIWNGPSEGSGFDTTGASGGNYRAFVALLSPFGEILTDDGGNNLSGNYEFEIDITPPEIYLDFPANGSTQFGTRVKLNYTAIDPSGVETCSVFHNQSGLFVLEQTKAYNNASENNFTITGFTSNTAIRWNVQCNDTAGNTGFAEFDYRFNMIVPPDFTLNESDIEFQTENIIEGVNMTINATITNEGGQSGSVVVQFFDGHPQNGTQIGQNISLTLGAEGGTDIAQVNWTAEIGPHQIYVILDPPFGTNGTVVEINESNNLANRSLDVKAWQYFYGGTATDKVLADTNITNITLWLNQTRLSGSIFMTDTESSIDWTALQAIGRNASGQATANDFADIDAVLNMTTFNDSVSNTYTTDGNTPKRTETISVYYQSIANVPLVNSTNTTHFTTGILWDTSDDSDGEFDTTETEDLVFVSRINTSAQGAYGIYDYEIGIPVKLREYDLANIQDAYLYFDLE